METSRLKTSITTAWSGKVGCSHLGECKHEYYGMKWVVSILLALTLSLATSTAYYKIVSSKAIGELGVATERLKEAQESLRLKELNTIKENEISSAINTVVKDSFDVYLTTKKQIEASRSARCEDRGEVVKQVKNSVTVNDDNLDTFRLLNEAYDKLYGTEDTKSPIR